MHYENIKQYKASQFQRLVGVQPATFQAMVDEVPKKTKNQLKRRKEVDRSKYRCRSEITCTEERLAMLHDR